MNKLFTPAQLAERWGMSVEALATQRFRRKGCKFTKLGHKTIRYREDDVLAYEQSCMVQTAGGTQHDPF